MNGEYTFAIIKPNAVKKGKTGAILEMINDRGFEIAALKMVRVDTEQAESFYNIHRDKPFFRSLIDFMTSGPVVVMILKHPNAVEEFRKLIGATDPAKAEEGTIRKLFADSLTMNAVHGSDNDENVKRESGFFFPETERYL